ncbi:MAG: isocitrate lyase/PEP mutase family protein [Solirubrobacterales bacterium]
MTPSQLEKGQTFQDLHEGEPFVIPNPWDAGSAQTLAKLGFQALASTSGGFAQTLGRADGEVSFEEAVEHARTLDRATDLPVSMDLENGYGPAPADAALAITSVAVAGAVGGSIEDWDRDGGFIYEPDQAAERVAAAVDAARALDFPFTLTARAENHFRGNPDLDDTIRRLQAYEAAGADVLFAPGLRSDEEIRTLCGAVSKPVNVLAFPDMSMERIATAGAQRVSVGSWLAHIASQAAMAAASKIRESGVFSALSA